MQWPRIKWLSLYVPLLEACIYFAGIVVTGGGVVHLENGNELSLMKYCGWLVTVPVLLLQLCRLPVQCANRNDKMSALLVINQLMLTFGLGAESLGSSLAGSVLFVLACLLGFVLYVMVFAIYRKTITELGDNDKYKKHRFTLQVLFFVFYLSWTLFPLSQFLRTIMNSISKETDLVIHVVADLMSKNVYGIILYYYVWKLKPDIETVMGSEDSEYCGKVNERPAESLLPANNDESKSKEAVARVETAVHIDRACRRYEEPTDPSVIVGRYHRHIKNSCAVTNSGAHALAHTNSFAIPLAAPLSRSNSQSSHRHPQSRSPDGGLCGSDDEQSYVSGVVSPSISQRYDSYVEQNVPRRYFMGNEKTGLGNQSHTGNTADEISVT